MILYFGFIFPMQNQYTLTKAWEWIPHILHVSQSTKNALASLLAHFFCHFSHCCSQALYRFVIWQWSAIEFAFLAFDLSFDLSPSCRGNGSCPSFGLFHHERLFDGCFIEIDFLIEPICTVLDNHNDFCYNSTESLSNAIKACCHLIKNLLTIWNDYGSP